VLAAQLQVKEQARRDEILQKRQLDFAHATLRNEWQALLTRTSLVAGEINIALRKDAAIPEGTRDKCHLKRPAIADDWAFMSLLPKLLFERNVQLYALVDEHNFDLNRALMGSTTFLVSVRERLQMIQEQAIEALRESPGVSAERLQMIRDQTVWALGASEGVCSPADSVTADDEPRPHPGVPSLTFGAAPPPLGRRQIDPGAEAVVGSQGDGRSAPTTPGI